MPDFDDTTNCPIGTNCAYCDDTSGLAVATLDVPLGVLCMTICPRCRARRRAPGLGLIESTRMVITHARHVGADLATTTVPPQPEQGTP